MLSTFVLLMSALPTAAEAAAPPAQAPLVVPEPSPVAALELAPVVRTNELVKLIAREAIVQQDLERAAVRPDVAGVFSAQPRHDRYADFAVKFAEARTPSCLGPDGLKFNPPRIGPIGVGGILAVPWVLAAKLKGKCN